MPLAAILNQEITRWAPSIVFVTASDAVSFVDNATENVALPRAISDTISFSETVTRTVALTRSAADSISFSETATENVALPRSISDSISFSETVTRSAALVRSAADSISFSETAKENVGLPRSVSDSIVFSDAPLENVALFRTSSDAVSFSDSSTEQTNFHPHITAFDAIQFTDVATQVASSVFFPSNLQQLILSVIRRARAQGIGIYDGNVVSIINSTGNSRIGAYARYSQGDIEAAILALRQGRFIDNSGNVGSLRIIDPRYA
jgi:hypothetical protein